MRKSDLGVVDLGDHEFVGRVVADLVSEPACERQDARHHVAPRLGPGRTLRRAWASHSSMYARR